MLGTIASIRRPWRRRYRDWSKICRYFTSGRKTPDMEIQVPHGPPLRLEFGKLAKFADGSAVASMGDTSVLVTSVSKVKPTSSSFIPSFVPLTVDYRQKSAAAGRIPTNFLRRELGPTEREILTSRIIDRSVRPLFPKGFGMETQLVCNLLAVDGRQDPDIVAINAASASLAMSDIPWNGPVGAVRVGFVDNKLVINPLRRDMMKSDLNLVVSGSADGKAVMLEAEAKNIDKNLFLDGLSLGLECCSVIAKEIQTLCSGQSKRNFSFALDTYQNVFKDMDLMCTQKVFGIFHDTSYDKISRDNAVFKIRDDAIANLKENYPQLDPSVFYEFFNQICRKIVAKMVLQDGQRVDGRSLESLRNISCEVNLHPPLHGSALFQRGQTQVFCTVALDSEESALKTDPVSVVTGAVKEKNFFLHYEFPPYATNDIGRTTFGRRELGHGALAEKGLKAVIPQNYPFTIRLTSEVLESNGSSSMASVCGGSLALLDAGVPIYEPAAGVAVGLVSECDETSGQILQHATLLDILGLEDYLGDMDFKLAGTKSGITALQVDVKIPGLPYQLIEEALSKGHDGISRIIDIMNNVIATPRSDKSNLPVTEDLQVPPHKRSKLIGPGGINLRRLTANTGVQITQKEEGLFSIFAPNSEAMTEAKENIQELLEDAKVPEFEFGSIINVTVLEVKEKGVVVEMHPLLDPVFIHVSQLVATKATSTSNLDFEPGQTLKVKYFGRDPVTGSVRLSRKILTVANAGAVRMLKTSTKSQTGQNIIVDEGHELSEESPNLSSNEVKIDGVERSEPEKVKEPDKILNSMQFSSDEKSLYYEIDVILNEIVEARNEVRANQRRLEEAGVEVEKTKSKYLLVKNNSTNRIFSDAFMESTYDAFNRALSRKKAIEESLRTSNFALKHLELKFRMKRQKIAREPNNE